MPEKSLKVQIAEYINKQGQEKLEEFDKKTDSQARKHVGIDKDAGVEFLRERAQLRRVEEQKYEPANWLTLAASRAKQISYVTHALKYSHKDAKGSSVMSYSSQEQICLQNKTLICTESIDTPIFDFDCNAAFFKEAKLLQLQFNGMALIEHLAKNDSSAFEAFSDDAAQIQAWVNGFKSVLVDQELSSHKLAKQLYFPTGDGDYHLISPLFASSLAELIYRKVANSRYSEEAKELRKLKKERVHSDQMIIDFVDIAIQNFGGSKPQNISLLNSARGGQAFLFSAQPPAKWTTRVKPPVANKGAFWQGLMRQRGVYRTLKEFRGYLESTEKSLSTKKIRDRRASYVEDIIDQVLQYAAVIQSLPSDWSDVCELPVEERLWLDLENTSIEFQENREKNEWQDKVARRFASWLNSQLNRSKSLAFSDVEFNEWRNAIKRDLELSK